MNALLVCCTPCVCDSRIILDTNAIWITLIICVTIITTILGLVLFYNNYKKFKKITDLENEKQQLKDNLSKNEDDLKKAKESLDKKEKKTKDFLDYCYKMVEKGDEEQRKDCWKIILHIHANCIPDELKQKYNVGNNVVEKVSKTEQL